MSVSELLAAGLQVTITNMESQLKEQGAADKIDDVLQEIPRVREDLGFIPLVTPTSQIVGTQAVLNVLMGERYKTITKETAGVLKGEYGATLAPVNSELQARVLDGAEPITCRPADLLQSEMDSLTAELRRVAKAKGIQLAKDEVDDVLIYALTRARRESREAGPIRVPPGEEHVSVAI